MAYRTKIITLFAVLGFFVGAMSYFVYHWIVTNRLVNLSMFMSPPIISGLAGALLSVIMIIVYARIAKNR